MKYTESKETYDTTIKLVEKWSKIMTYVAKVASFGGILSILQDYIELFLLLCH